MQQSARPERSAPPSASILLACDEQPICDVLQQGFRDTGFEFAYITNGHSAAEAAKGLKPDVVLIDVDVAPDGGLEVERRLREVEALADVPVIFLSASYDEDLAVAAYERGAYDYIVKPFSTRVVVAQVRALVERRRREVTSPEEIRPGTTVDGRYRLVRELGRGGIAIVFLADHLGLKQRVALKALRVSDDDAGHGRERFEREARALAHLRHKNLVRIYDAGTWGRIPFFVMEYVPGGTLAQLLHKQGRLDARRALQLTIGIAEGVHHAHEHQILHRDLKTANILLAEDGTPVVTDFGLLLSVREPHKRLTEHGLVVGTPHYMSPEQIRTPKDVDARSDVYSIGVLLYEMLTGRTPYHELTSMDAMIKIMGQQPPPARQLHADIPLPVDLCCMRALAIRPDRRYQTARELAQAARKALQSI